MAKNSRFQGLIQPLDDNGNPVPVSFWDTANAQLIDGTSVHAESAVISATINKVVRLAATTADVWIKIGTAPVAVDQQGTWLGQSAEKEIAILAGDKISVIGGKLNITPCV